MDLDLTIIGILLLILNMVVAASEPHFNVTLPDDFPTLPNLRIIGGQEAKPHEFPFQVSMQIALFFSSLHVCGGSIISEHWVMTSAMCTKSVRYCESLMGCRLTLVAGVNNPGKYDRQKQIREVGSVVVHEKFSFNFTYHVPDYDIALIKLNKPFYLNENVAKINLPVYDSEPPGQGMVSGWGTTNETDAREQYEMKPLRKAKVSIFSTRCCRINYAKEFGVKVPLVLNKRFICAGYFNATDISSCHGDSGAALVVKNKNNETEAVGITSWGLRCKGPTPYVYLKVSYFTDWIMEHIK